MSEVIDKSELHILNPAGDMQLTSHVEQDVSEVIRDNHRECETSNGFSDGRTMRKVMSISSVDYLNALKLGYALDNDDPKLLQSEVRRYLREKGQEDGMQTVRHILTPGYSGRIIVK